MPQRPQWPFGVNWNSPQAAGLIGWWPMEPSGGLKLYDFARHQSVGLSSTGIIWGKDAAVGRYLEFNGSTGIATGGDLNNATEVGTQLSVSCWLNMTTLSNLKVIVAKWTDAGNPDDGWVLETRDNTGLLWAVTATGSDYVEAAGVIPSTGVWYHIAATFDGSLAANSRLKVYVNGLNVGVTTFGTPPTTLPTTSHNFSIGDQATGGRPIAAKIADVRIYNRSVPEPVIQEMWLPETRCDLYRPLGLSSPRPRKHLRTRQINRSVAPIGMGGI